MLMGCQAWWPGLFEDTGGLGQFRSRRFRYSQSPLGPWLPHLYLATVGENVWQALSSLC